MTKAMMGRTLVGVACLCLLVSCRRRQGVTIVDLAPARLGPTAEVVVDGAADEAAWRKPAVIPFEGKGHAKFVWDESRLYGFIEKYEHQRGGFDVDEQICVSIRRGQKTTKLFFEQPRPVGGGCAALVLRHAWVVDRNTDPVARHVLPPGAIQVVGRSSLAQQGFGWTVEFSVDWASGLDTPGPSGETLIHVYRIVPKRPTHVLRME